MDIKNRKVVRCMKENAENKFEFKQQNFKNRKEKKNEKILTVIWLRVKSTSKNI